MYGKAEGVVGDLAAGLGLREKLFFATKVWTSGREAGIRQMENSFKLMRAGRMDLMQVHNLLDVATHQKTLREWKAAGRIRYLGITHYHAGAHEELGRLLRTREWDFAQFNYSMAEREAEARLLPLCAELGVAVVVNRPFAEGALFRQVKGKELPAWAAEFDCASWAQFFLKWILSHPAVTCAIPGTRRTAHLRGQPAGGNGAPAGRSHAAAHGGIPRPALTGPSRPRFLFYRDFRHDASMIRRALIRTLALALCLTTLGGCTMLRLGYGQLDTFAAWTANDYFDLDAHQKQEFITRFDRLHDWHRYEELPEYASFLNAARDKVQKGLTRDDMLWFSQGIQERYRRLVTRAADDSAAILATIAPEQLAALQKRWEKDNRKFISEHKLEAGAEEQRRARARKMLKQVEDWVGVLSPEQEEKIAAMAGRLPATEQLRHADRVRRQREFLKLMEQRASPQFPARLRHWLANWEEGRPSEQEKMMQQGWSQRYDLYLAVERMLTPQQRATLMSRLQRHADDFARLSRRSGVATVRQP